MLAIPGAPGDTFAMWARFDSIQQQTLISGARDTEPVRGLTHDHYRYPARFSPAFARSAIVAFTKPRDLVLDPYAGGGTTLVEALALGRDAVGVDISQLAEFVSTAKTIIYTDAELNALDAWSRRSPAVIGARKHSIHFPDYDEAGYYKHLDDPPRWRLRKAIEQGLGHAIALGDPRLEMHGRCVVLRTAQWALDGRPRLPSLPEFRAKIGDYATEMLAGARALSAAVAKLRRKPRIRTLRRSTAGLEDDALIRRLRAPRLILTSPPYPGVHVLYHRWQVDGRREAPAPFMIAGKLDGAGSSYYTMGDRKYPELATYFDNLRNTMELISRIADENTVIVQMIAFSDPSWQLERYLTTMRDAGLQELFLPALRGERDGRLWRSVPGRRWYSDQRGETPGSKEVVLIHRCAGGALMQPRVRPPSKSCAEAYSEA